MGGGGGGGGAMRYILNAGLGANEIEKKGQSAGGLVHRERNWKKKTSFDCFSWRLGKVGGII